MSTSVAVDASAFSPESRDRITKAVGDWVEDFKARAADGLTVWELWELVKLGVLKAVYIAEETRAAGLTKRKLAVEIVKHGYYMAIRPALEKKLGSWAAWVVLPMLDGAIHGATEELIEGLVGWLNQQGLLEPHRTLPG